MKKLKIVQDNFFENDSPRNWDNLGTIVYNHRNYIVGDENMGDPVDWFLNELGIEIDRAYELAEKLNINTIYSNEFKEYLQGRFENENILLPVYMYDHSGITISTKPFSCRWDSGQVGIIYVSKEKVRKEYGVKRVTKKVRELALSVLKGEIEIFDMYLRGDIYGFEIIDENGYVEDSCWGFYGTDWENNGIKEHISNDLHPQLEGIEVSYEYPQLEGIDVSYEI